MRVQEKFKNVFSYSAGVEDWCKAFYKEVCGRELTTTFCSDFAIADWYGEDSVKETFERVKTHWLSDYKYCTELAVSLAYLSYANDQLSKQGIEDRDKYVSLYWELYEKARDLFYETYKDNKEATDHFFEWTD